MGSYRSEVLADIGVNALKIDVDVTNGIVSLRGKLGDAAISEAAIKKTGRSKVSRKSSTSWTDVR